MLFSRLVKKRLKKNSSDSEGVGCMIALVLIVLVTALVLNIIMNVKEPEPLTLLTQAEGLVRLTNMDQIASHTSNPVYAPTETFGAELQIIGVYPVPNQAFPKGTVALVYARDGWRHVEINYKDLRLEEQLAITSGTREQEAILSDAVMGIFFNPNNPHQCIESPREDFPGKCTISKQLYFPLGDMTVVLSADGTHATEGEMIAMAKSILKQVPSQN